MAFKDGGLDVTRGECGEEQRLRMTRKPEETHVAKQSDTEEGAVSSIKRRSGLELEQ